jgi:hypothetical protein
MVTHLTELIRPIMDTETMDAVRCWSKYIGRDQRETNGNLLSRLFIMPHAY